MPARFQTMDHEDHEELQRHGYHNLMRFQIRDILLVSSLYDAFIWEEDGGLAQQIFGEYRDLGLSSPPRVIRVSTGEEALDELRSVRYDLVMTMSTLGDMDVYEFGRKAKIVQPGIPVILMVTDATDIQKYAPPALRGGVDKVFFYNGDSSIFLAITKYVEDMVNAPADTDSGLVRVVLVIENSIRYYSMFLPLIYREMMKQTKNLIAQSLNEHEKLLRRRARPKILLAETYEESVDLANTYDDHIMGVISDIRFPKDGHIIDDAGFQFIETLDEKIPVLIQSSHKANKKKADELEIQFLDKNSDTLLSDLRGFLKYALGFGNFIFRTPDGEAITGAEDLDEFLQCVRTVPAESLLYHGKNNHFSNWLMARGEVRLVHRLRPKTVEDFADLEDLRKFLISNLEAEEKEKREGVIMEFSRLNLTYDDNIIRYGHGSLGGKGRGIAFLGALMHGAQLQQQFPNDRITIPNSLIITTSEFNKFIDDNELGDLFEHTITEEEVDKRFKGIQLNEELRVALQMYLDKERNPIAVRSSSLLEDSQNQPFAGIYNTFILPNNHPDPMVRLYQLTKAILMVYRSVFSTSARKYIKSTVHLAQEERMAVVVQRLVGNTYGNRFYPLFSGVAQSHNFYPVEPLKREDGICNIGLGLGKIVVDGGRVMGFSPKHPKIIPGFSTVEQIFQNSQESFYALDLSEQTFDLSIGEEATLVKLPVADAEQDGTLDLIASTFDANDNILRDGPYHPGPKLLTFGPVLSYGIYPLCDIIQEVLRIGEEGMGKPVELEFAVNRDKKGKLVFNILQIRPLVTLREHKQVHINEERERKNSFVFTKKALGNVLRDDIKDILFIPPDKFDSAKTVAIANEIGKFNTELEGRPYMLIGFGRWGTQDPWLGIPVDWDQISGAMAIVEASLEDFRVDPSHGTHFFHNVTSLGLAYLTVPYGKDDASIDWEWLESLPVTGEGEFVKHVQLEEPILVKVDGREGTGIALPSIRACICVDEDKLQNA